MKMFQWTLMVVFYWLSVSCSQWGSKENNRLIRQAELLAELNPNNALLLLDSMNTALFSNAEKAAYTILRIQAKDNAGLDLSTDIEIFQARDYFIRNGKNPEQVALACLFAGKVVDAKDNIAVKINYYREALDFAKKTNNEMLQGEILYNMFFLDFDDNSINDVISLHQQALNIFKSASDQRQQEIYILIAIGNSSIIEQKTDSAQHYFAAALNKALLLDKPALQVAIYENIMDSYIKLEKLDMAKHAGNQALNLTLSESEKISVYLNFAQLFHVENIIDSSRFYLAKAEPFISTGDDVYELTKFYRLCCQIEKNAGNHTKALEYLELSTKYLQELTDWNGRQKLLEFQKKFKITKLEIKYNKEKNRLWRLAGILGVMSFLLIIGYIVVKKRNIKQTIALTKIEHEIREKDLELEKVKHEKSEAEQNMHIFQKVYEKQYNEIQINFLEKLKIIKSLLFLDASRKSSMIIISELNTIKDKFSLQEFVAITNVLYPGFTDKLKANYPNVNLSEKEISICCLIVCGFSNKELALFIHQKKDTQAVEKMKNRLRKKMNIPAYYDVKKYLLDKSSGNNLAPDRTV
jgi:tetratricopeptide (TPR) repeat protein